MVHVVEVVYRSAIADKIDEAINKALENIWSIKHIELTDSEWFAFKQYIFKKDSVGALEEFSLIDEIKYKGIKIIREG